MAKKIVGHIHHQVVADCPVCNNTIIEDLGELPNFEGMEVTCPSCGKTFELESE
jgi:hypothetical protein